MNQSPGQTRLETPGVFEQSIRVLSADSRRGSCPGRNDYFVLALVERSVTRFASSLALRGCDALNAITTGYTPREGPSSTLCSNY